MKTNILLFGLYHPPPPLTMLTYLILPGIYRAVGLINLQNLMPQKFTSYQMHNFIEKRLMKIDFSSIVSSLKISGNVLLKILMKTKYLLGPLECFIFFFYCVNFMEIFSRVVYL